MPIHDSPSIPKSWDDIKAQFVVFYASRDDNGVMWCPDCRAVEGLVKESFEAKDSPSAIIIYVGQRDEWKTPKNHWRQQPWDVQSIPTIVRTLDNKRLVEGEIKKEKLLEFING